MAYRHLHGSAAVLENLLGTLTNTQAGIKEMGHRIFKGIVPRTNRKNIDLDPVMSLLHHT